MSLSRLSRKRNRHKPDPDQHALTVISSKIRNSHSHESLLQSPASMESVDLNSADLDIKPLHSSVLGLEHCFQVSTSNGSKYISCRTAEERDKWIESLRKTVEPNQEQARRIDNSLKLWIVEAKNVAGKKRYFCEVYLDKTLYARTSSKNKQEMLFWGEHFEFNNLPAIETISVNLYREADRKKKKDKNTLLGYVNLCAKDLKNRQLVEKWFTSSSGTVGRIGKENKSDLPIIRLKVRYQTVQILPMEMYDEFTQYLSSNYSLLVEQLDPIVNVHDKESIAIALVNVMQKLNCANQFLSDVVIDEISKQDNHQLTFRGNTIATKAIEAYMKLVGEKFLSYTLMEFVKTLINAPEDCEVDPAKLPNGTVLQRHQMNLIMYCEMVWAKIINSYCYFPQELKEVFQSFRQRYTEIGKDDISEKIIVASIFLRYLCPAIMSPSLFNLTQEYPDEKASRNLTLIAKTVQTLANFTKFGGKEDYMIFMNDFVEREWGNMKNFLKQISTADSNSQTDRFDGFIDLGKELSILHSLFTQCLTDDANIQTCNKLNPLPDILHRITMAKEDPSIGSLKKRPNRRSQIYDNMVGLNARKNDKSYKPESDDALREVLINCGDTGSYSDQMDNQEIQGTPKRSDSYDEYVNVSSSYTASESKTVSNVSARPQFAKPMCQGDLNESWNEIVSVAEVVNGDYIDLISFMDDNPEHNSSLEIEPNINGSHGSIGQLSNVASSGYQSFGYSQSSSPVDSTNPPNEGDVSARHAHHGKKIQPVSFANPLYNSQVKSRIVPQQKTSSSSSLSSTEDANSVKHRSPMKSNRTVNLEPVRKYSQTSSSGSGDDSLDRPKYNRSNSLPQGGDVRFSLPLRSSSPISNDKSVNSNSNSHKQPSVSNSGGASANNTIPRTSEMWHSMDASQFTQNYECVRRPKQIPVIIAGNSKSLQNVNASDANSSSSNRTSYDDNAYAANRRLCTSPNDESAYAANRRLCTSPNQGQNSVHLGIRSVQRKIHEQEKSRQEYESELSALKQQVTEMQRHHTQLDSRLKEKQAETDEVRDQWQHRQNHYEERLRQQGQKEDRMRSIIQRLVQAEDDLRTQQASLQKEVEDKQKVIEAQEQRIIALDAANNKLLMALTQSKEQCSTGQNINGLKGAVRSKLIGDFKTSSC